MRNVNLPSAAEGQSATSSRRRALGMMLGGWALWPRLLSGDPGAPIRLAISESLVSDVSINDARAAMTIWIKRMEADLKIVIELKPKVFDTTEEIVHRARAGLFDAVALNVVEYHQIADVLDRSQIIAETDGAEQYILLVKNSAGVRSLSDLRGRRLIMLRSPKMCVAMPWLSTLLEQGNLGPGDQFFGSVATDIKPSRVVLPVFFGQADACLTSKRGFDLMGELNPQVAKNLTVIASSPLLVATFYTFHKNYRGPDRERFAKVYSNMPASAAGQQLATLFQFQGLAVRDAACLSPALGILDAADRVRARPGGGRK
jgi:phosphonate transport system substrate-binding protein